MSETTVDVPPVGITSKSFFSQRSVLQLSADYFALDSSVPIGLKYKNCMIVLFYAENAESRNLAQIIAITANESVGTLFAACNLAHETQIANAFRKLRESGSNPLRWASLRTVPFILTYRDGWPVAFYNGERAVQAILDWSLTLACNADYFEPKNEYAGQQATDNYEITGIKPYDPSAYTESLQFKGNENLRGYDPTKGITLVGSKTAEEEAGGETLSEEAPVEEGLPETVAAGTPSG